MAKKDSKPSYKAWFRSIRDHEETHALDEVVYNARDGALLEVAHDMGELAKTSGAAWKKLFEERWSAASTPTGSRCARRPCV